MPAHEKKICPRCQLSFECKAGSYTLCDCMTIKLTQEEQDLIAGRYDDCLCLACLQALKNKPNFFTEKFRGT